MLKIKSWNYVCAFFVTVFILSSGLSTAYAQVNNPPTVTIEIPADGSHFIHNQSINFRGIASDPEDGSLTFFIDWSSDVGR